MHLLWFRRDLRLTDNEIVTLATQSLDPYLPLMPRNPAWRSLSFWLVPTLVSSIPAQWKKLVSVGSGMSAVQ